MKIYLGTMKKELQRMTSNGNEVRSFMRLNDFEQFMLLTEMWERMFARFWLGGKSIWVRNSSGAKNNQANEDARLETEVLSTIMSLKSKDMGERTMEAKPVKTADGFVPLSSLKKVKVPKATAEVAFSYDQKKMILKVEILEVTALSDADKRKYENALNEELQETADRMNDLFAIDEDFSPAEKRAAKRECVENMLVAFFNTLHANHKCQITGNEAAVMYRVYRNAYDTYPAFRSASFENQVAVLDDGFAKARTYKGGSRDVHSFAKSTFYALYSRGMVNRVYRMDPVFGNVRHYDKVGENTNEKHDLIFLEFEYECGAVRLRTAFKPFDLWHILAVGNRAESNAVGA